MDKIIGFLTGITEGQAVFITAIITFLLYFFSKRDEIKLKKHELKKDTYFEFISFVKKSMFNEIDFTREEAKKDLFDFGSRLLVYGSKKIYKKYCLFRILSSPRISSCYFYDDQLALYLATDIFNQIRKEIGLNNFETYLNFDAISFYVNDLYMDKKSKLMWYKNKIKFFMLIFELKLNEIFSKAYFIILFEILMLPFKMLFLVLRRLFDLILVFINKILKRINKFFEKEVK